MVWRFDSASPEFQFVEKHNWLGVASYHMGVDGISLPFVILTTALMPICILASWTVIQKRVKEYMIAFLVLEALMVGTFAALDLVLFYLFFEGGLIPMFLIIGIWGGERRIYATLKFVLYTAFGSILMLAAVIYLVWSQAQATGNLSFAFEELASHPLSLEAQGWMLAAFALSFAIKVPMVPLHTWLPDAHVEAPTAGSVILAGVLLKMGTYGFMKLGFPLFTKPANAGSSVGVRRVACADELGPALEHAFEFDHKLLLERAMRGREIECAVLGNDRPRASVPGEIIPVSEFYDYEAKYLDESSQLLIPAPIDPALSQHVRDLSRQAFLALDCAGMARVDFLLARATSELYAITNQTITTPTIPTATQPCAPIISRLSFA